MQARNSQCNDHRLQEMMESQQAADHFSDLLLHVEGCKRCQQRLDELAAEPTLWSNAATALTGFSSSDPFRQSSNYQNGLPADEAYGHSVAWTESMARQLLSPPSHPEMLGRIGRYEVERLIGSGGMGIVFKAIDTELNRPVAIKLLAPYLAGNGAARQRFAREAKAAAAVVHEHVVPIHNVETDGQSPYLVMRYVAGESLQARIDREGALELCQILRIAMQVASGLAAAHAQGLVHRDIKPSNILVESGIERSLITDFGLARAADDASLTNTGYHPGTPQYMSPEQARGDAMDSRSDLFSLGSVIYTMCTGRAPFRAETSYGILRRITDTQPHPIQEINPTIPGWLSCLIAKLMDKSTETRIQSAQQLAQLLEGCLAHAQRPHLNPLPSIVREWETASNAIRNSHSRRKTYYMFAATGVLLVAISSVLLPWSSWWPSSGSTTGSSTNPQSDPTQSSKLAGDLAGQSSRSDKDNSSGPSKDKAKSANLNNQSQTSPTTNPRGQQPQSKQTQAKQPQPKQPRGPRFAMPDNPAEKVRTLLASEAQIEFASAGLTDCLDELLRDSAVTYHVYQKSFDDEELKTDQLVSIKAAGSKHELLSRICEKYSAAYIVRDKSIDIVPERFAANNPTLRYYDLSFLLTDNSQVQSILSAISQIVFRHDEAKFSVSHTYSLVDSVLIVRTTEAAHLQVERLLAQLSVTLQSTSQLQSQP